MSPPTMVSNPWVTTATAGLNLPSDRILTKVTPGERSVRGAAYAGPVALGPKRFVDGLFDLRGLVERSRRVQSGLRSADEDAGGQPEQRALAVDLPGRLTKQAFDSGNVILQSVEGIAPPSLADCAAPFLC